VSTARLASAKANPDTAIAVLGAVALLALAWAVLG
jgi:hypothetical protein